MNLEAWRAEAGEIHAFDHEQLFPVDVRVVVVDASGERELRPGERIPEHAELPGLTPDVAELFAQVLSAK